MPVSWLLFAASVVYELSGRIEPESLASVSVYGATTPFHTSTLSDARGRFRIRKLLAGTYTVAVFIPGKGEARQTVEVGPGTAGAGRRVPALLRFQDSDFVARDALRRRHAVSAKQLAVPGRALREFDEASKALSRRAIAEAVEHLERAVEIAPQYANAWNTLGTVNYQTRNFARAEECFRRSLDEDPEAYEPLVNLGGVLVTLHKLDEAMSYNLHAMLVRPNDALANSQLGMTYFELGRFELALKYLERARQIDRAHFSHPQLLIAEIRLRQRQPTEAAEALEDFLRQHPDWPAAAKLRETIGQLRHPKPGS
jgi:tetratricopeptide (TPR) repeat protein